MWNVGSRAGHRRRQSVEALLVMVAQPVEPAIMESPDDDELVRAVATGEDFGQGQTRIGQQQPVDVILRKRRYLSALVALGADRHQLHRSSMTN